MAMRMPRNPRALVAILAVIAAPVALSLTGMPQSAVAEQQPSALNTLGAIATATTEQLSTGSTAIELGHVQAALTQVQASTQPDAAAWTVLDGTAGPAQAGQYSVGFDDGQNVASGLPDVFGTRVAIVTVDGDGYAGTVLTLEGATVTCSLGTDTDTAAALLAGVGADLACPDPSPVSGPSAITSLWAWGNSVDPAADNRGLGEAGMAPQAIADFASAHGIGTVFLSVPWASNQGAIASWLAASVDDLHAEGIRVAALGGDSGWLAEPQLAAEWMSDAMQAADFDAVELDIEPWSGVANPDFATITPALDDTIDAVRSVADGRPVGIDLPWWLATTDYDSSTVFSALLPHVDSVAITAFADHADGSDGIVALAAPAVALASAAGLPFTIGVETDTPAVAGGAQFTFYDSSNDTFSTETAKVRTAFAGTPGYAGVSVEHLLSWSALLAR
jgi:hypothetical protein